MRRLAILAFAALLLLQPLWHGWLQPPRALPVAAVVVVAMLPLLLPAAGLLRRRSAALFWAGLVSLPYFCHGVAEAWASPPARALGLLEAVLALVVVLAVGLHGLALRRRQRPDRGPGL